MVNHVLAIWIKHSHDQKVKISFFQRLSGLMLRDSDILKELRGELRLFCIDKWTSIWEETSGQNQRYNTWCRVRECLWIPQEDLEVAWERTTFRLY